MKMKYTVTVFLLLSLLVQKNEAIAQLDVQRFRNALDDGKTKTEYWQAKSNKNEVQVVFSGLFLFYKNFLSSQDLTVCTFTPSCSEYGILAIKEHGLVKGGMMTMDRLTRCNGLSPTKYEYDTKQRLLKDDPNGFPPVQIVSNIK